MDKINYSETNYTGFRIARTERKTTEFFPKQNPYYATIEDAVKVLSACILKNPANCSFVKFEIVYEECGTKRPIK